MKTFFVSTHVSEEFNLVPSTTDKGYIDEVFGENRLIVIGNIEVKELPELSFSDDEVVILLYHGKHTDIKKKYNNKINEIMKQAEMHL